MTADPKSEVSRPNHAAVGFTVRTASPSGLTKSFVPILFYSLSFWLRQRAEEFRSESLVRTFRYFVHQRNSSLARTPMAGTQIEWTDATWNPVAGCIPVG